MATNPNATKMVVPADRSDEFEQLRDEMLADLQRTKLNSFEQGILDEVIYGRPRLVPFTVQRHDPYAERSVGARAVQTNRIVDEPNELTSEMVSDAVRELEKPQPDPLTMKRPVALILTEDQARSLNITRPFRLNDLRWCYQTVFQPKPSKENKGMSPWHGQLYFEPTLPNVIKDMLAAGWSILPMSSAMPKGDLVFHFEGFTVHRPITPAQMDAVHVALGKRSEADDGVTLTSISHPFSGSGGGKMVPPEQFRAHPVSILPPDTSIRARVVAIDGVSQEQAHQIALLLERIFRADHEGSGRWLREHCGPLGSTPIKALEDGRTEKVIAYLEAAAP